MERSKMRQAIEKIAPQLLKAVHVFIDGYSVNDPETGERKSFTKYRMKWAQGGRDLTFTGEQVEKIMKLPGVVRVDHTSRWPEDKYNGTFYKGPVVTFTAKPSTLLQ